jgi:hypothetical protein
LRFWNVDAWVRQLTTAEAQSQTAGQPVCSLVLTVPVGKFKMPYKVRLLLISTDLWINDRGASAFGLTVLMEWADSCASLPGTRQNRIHLWEAQPSRPSWVASPVAALGFCVSYVANTAVLCSGTDGTCSVGTRGAIRYSPSLGEGRTASPFRSGPRNFKAAVNEHSVSGRQSVGGNCQVLVLPWMTVTRRYRVGCQISVAIGVSARAFWRRHGIQTIFLPYTWRGVSQFCSCSSFRIAGKRYSWALNGSSQSCLLGVREGLHQKHWGDISFLGLRHERRGW